MNTADPQGSAIVGAILAGGRAQRIGGGDKPLRMVAGRSILARIVDVLSPQCRGLLLNANGDPGRFASFGIPVVPDDVAGFAGPLAGILAALDWTAVHRPDAAWVLTVPSDAPFLPRDLVARLAAARLHDGAELALASSGGRLHPVVGLWPIALRHELRHAVVAESLRKVGLWTARHRFAAVAWDTRPVDPFFNANTREDFAEAERLAAEHPGQA